MASSVYTQDKGSFTQPYLLSKSVFRAFRPLEQAAAQALEQCGIVKIVEEDDLCSTSMEVS